MTKRTVRRWFRAAVLLFVAMIAAGIGLSAADRSEHRVVYGTFKDLIPLMIAIPAAWLGFCVQRRSAYLQQLRSLWSKLIDAVQSATSYTYLEKPSQQDRADALLKMSIAIDEIRGVFCNIGETGREDGLYPFEPLKDIYCEIAELAPAEPFDSGHAIRTRKRIFALWKEVRRELLREFDREEPTFSHSHWADASKSDVYDGNAIPKRPS
ncbi:MAG TPA: hypothetical protein VMF30_04885 [Pirellulales bacterium]|nr:hypothetical protein [Pirellulales bacterium]